MQAALKRAGIKPQDISYINSHGTSTLADTIELSAVERLFNEPSASLKMSSTKSSIGHLLGAAGAVEAIFCIMAIRDQMVPATLNLNAPASDTWIDLVPNLSVSHEVNYTLSNSFGFGGTNAALVIGRFQN